MIKQKPVKILFVDTETLSIERYKNKNCIWQIAGHLEIDGKLVEEFNWTMNSGDEDIYDQGCLDFNKLTIDDVRKFESCNIVYDKFIALLDKHCSKYDSSDKIFICGYNVTFDTDHIRNWFGKNDLLKGSKYQSYGSYFWSNTLDVMDYMSLIFIKHRNLFINFKLGTVVAKCVELRLIDSKFNDSEWHDAMQDILATKALFKFCVKAFKLKLFED